MVLAFMKAGSGWCANNSLTLSVSERQEYNDNIYYIKDNPLDDFIITVAPTITYKRETEKSDVTLKGKIASQHFRENKELNRTDQRVDIDFGSSITERITASGSLSLNKDSRPDRNIDTTGIVMSDSVRKQLSCQLEGQYILSERSSVGLSSVLHKEKYKKDSEDGVGDFNYRQAGLSFKRYMTMDTTLEANVSYVLYEYPQQEIDNWSGTLGIVKKITEHLDGNLHLGGRATNTTHYSYMYIIDETSFEIVKSPVEEKTKKTGVVGRFGLSWKGKSTSSSLSAEHDLYASSGTNATTQRFEVHFSFLKKLDTRFAAIFNGRFFHNRFYESNDASEDKKIQTVRVQQGIQYQPNRWISLNAYYRYTRIEDRIGKEIIENNAAWLQIAVRIDLMDHNW